jgi:hypothetical protein
MNKEFKFTREWFMDKDNQVHTIQDVELFNDKECKNIIQIGEHFLLDLIPIDNDVEIWEVTNTRSKHYCKERGQWFNFEKIRKVTTGKQFGYPNGYWKVPKEELLSKLEDDEVGK